MLSRILNSLLVCAFLIPFQAMYTGEVEKAHAAQVITNHVIQGSWRPVLHCAGCNPGNAWEGPGYTNTVGQSVLLSDLQFGDTISVQGIGGSVDDGVFRVPCETGLPGEAFIPRRMPIIQFLDDHGNVVPLAKGGYNGTNAVRITDLQRSKISVPRGATKIWGSWPDEDYSDNLDMCYFSIVHVSNHTGLPRNTQPSTSDSVIKSYEQDRSGLDVYVPTQQQQVAPRHVPSTSVHNVTTAPSTVLTNPQTQPSEPLSHIVTPRPVRLTTRAMRLTCKAIENSRENRRVLTEQRKRNIANRLASRTRFDVHVMYAALSDGSFCTHDPSSSSLRQTDDGRTVQWSTHNTTAYQPDSSAQRSTSTTAYSTTTGGGSSDAMQKNDSASPASQNGEEDTGSAQSAEHMDKLQYLCRVKQRIEARGSDVSHLFKQSSKAIAERWSMDQMMILKALKHPELCTDPPRDLLMKAAAKKSMSPKHPLQSVPHDVIVVAGVALAILILMLILILRRS